MKKIRLAIIGTRGIPASYSGFETSVEETSIRFARNKLNTTVYCRKNHYTEYFDNYNDVKLVYLPSIKTKHLDTITNTFLSTIHCIIKKYNVVLVYGIGNSIFLLIFKIFRIKTISIVDGADWERNKWGKFAKIFLKFSRFLAVNLSHYYVVDNEILMTSYNKIFRKKPIYIPYGANFKSSYSKEILNKYNLKIRNYLIFIGRFVKEKRIEFLINNFLKLNSDIKLVIVGGNSIDKEYENKILSLGSSKIVFTGFLYGDQYESLLHYAKSYVSSSELEGTSPSLLSAMAINGYALVSNLKENKATLKGSCKTFEKENSNDFIKKLDGIISSKNLNREKTFKIVKKHYNWDVISNQYIELIIN